jgi:hypothetical protein
MKTILDNFYEVSLVTVIEDEHGLRCEVSPMKVDSRRNIVEDSTQEKQLVDFGLVSGYLVLPEFVQVILNLQYLDNSVILEVPNSSLLNYFQFNLCGQANRHFVLRTSHQYVNVFVDADSSESMERLIKVYVKRGNHLGSKDMNTGEITEPPVPGS